MPQEGLYLEKVENLLRNFTRKIPGLQDLTYLERLKALKMNSEQRRLERYQIIYAWKIIEGLPQTVGSTGLQPKKGLEESVKFPHWKD